MNKLVLHQFCRNRYPSIRHPEQTESENKFSGLMRITRMLISPYRILSDQAQSFQKVDIIPRLRKLEQIEV
jgi:hypothetical protein